MAKAWMVRAGKGGYIIEHFIEQSVVAIGWAELPDLTNVANKAGLKDLVAERYADFRQGQISNWAGQLSTFRFDIKPGDGVVSYDAETRSYHIGEVVGEYRYDPKAIELHAHILPVKWSAAVKRDDVSVSSRNTLGAIQTVFSLNTDVWSELKSLAKGETPKKKVTEPGGDVTELGKDIIARSHEFIKDCVLRLAWDEMQDLIAGLLRAMGYQTRVSPPGADRGKDIIASPDGLGLEQPRIRVEVKHRPNESIGAPAVRSFIGTLRQGDKGVFVSTGGFSKEAHYEAERAQFPVTLMDLDDLVAHVTSRYEQLDTSTRSLIPLVRVYWPAG